MDKLVIFTAGVAKQAVYDTAERWNRIKPGMRAEICSAGSVDLARRIISGQRCDVFVSADEAIMSGMLMPRYADGYVIFAGNSIVIEDKKRQGLSEENWPELLLKPGSRFRHKNPYGDPGGYRGVMALLLADKFRPGLTKKLMEHPGHLGMDKDMTAENAPEHDYLFTYYSMAKSSGAAFARLPDIMNLSKDELSGEYAQVSFAVDENNTVYGSAIAHCAAVPKTSPCRGEAAEFIKLFLENDFGAYNFIPKREYKGRAEELLK